MVDYMSEYFLQLPAREPRYTQCFWKAGNGRAEKLGVTNSERYPIIAQAGEDILTALQNAFSGSVFYKMRLGAGEYFPRMARPTGAYELSPGKNPDPHREFQISRAKSTGQLHAFIGQLQGICQTIHPEGDNLRTYGHATRNLLILACTEVELLCRQILEDNGYRSMNNDGRFTTRDYVKILKPMRLDEYVVNLTWYPWLSPTCPFVYWQAQQPTKSLPWYNAYNKVKHDREVSFPEATLRRAIDAVTACFVLISAQHGLDFARMGEDGAREFFQLEKAPSWDFTECYVPPNGAGYSAVHYSF
jgi:hypothetical protein